MPGRRIHLLAALTLAATLLAHAVEPQAPREPAPRARNIVLFLGDGMGLSTVNAASIHAHGRSGALFIQSLPHIGLSDTSAANNWVSDSAAGMTAIMTGRKTLNGVIGQAPEGAVRGVSDGAELKSLLEDAEERGLSTGIVTSDQVTGATPAACYARVNDRGKHADIAAQLAAPRFGDGPDLVAGRGREWFLPAASGGSRTDERDLLKEMQASGYRLVSTPQDLASLSPGPGEKVLALFDGPYELAGVIEHAIRILDRNPRGFFLMVEWDCHQRSARESLENTLQLDRAARRVRELKDAGSTLLLVTADHSYDLRFPRGAAPGADILPGIVVDGHHTAEEVIVAADGPGAALVRGFMRNTDIFRVMRAAFGWPEP